MRNGKHVLVLGAGSAGKRHAGNLASLGCRISCMDPRPDRVQEAAEQVEIAGGYGSMEEAFSRSEGIDGVVVTSPPAFHVEQGIASLERGLPVLMEKPVCPNEADARRLEEAVNRTGAPLLLTYTWRWWPPLEKVWDLLNRQAVGKLRHVEFVMSAHLADWHPWEDYKDFFMSSREQGGGALLDESHWVDLMLWFLGKPERLVATIEKISDLEIETDDNVEMLITYPDGLRVNVHLDLYGRPHRKSIRFVGEGGTILWTADPNAVAVGRTMEEEWERFTFDCERNEMFLAADREFVDVLNGGAVRTCSIQDGVRVLSVLEAARKSAETGQFVPVEL